jgi:hypothetical protein
MPLSRINTASIANNTIIAADLVAYSITANLIANSVITSAQIASNTLSNTVFQTGSVENYSRAVGLLGMRNRIINGAMVIDQRYAGTATANTINSYTLDRWKIDQSASTGKLVVQQNAGSVTPPAGFTNYLGVTSQSAYSVAAGDEYLLTQYVEGYNVADLGWGTANAKTITVSFWVRSSLTGSFGGSIGNSSGTRFYPFSYTVLAANTWEQKAITIVGDTSGTWLTTNGTGLYLRFGLGVGTTYGSGTAGAWTGTYADVPTGSVSVVGTNGATFYITGVQLEVGSSATGFEYRQYGQELALCQRYYEQWNAGSQYAVLPVAQIGYGNFFQYTFTPFVYKRTTPTVTLSSATGGSLFSAYGTNQAGGSFPWTGNLTVDSGGTGNLGIQVYSSLTGSSAGGAGTCVYVILRANQYIQFSAEL